MIDRAQPSLAAAARRAPRGMTLVELMVGVAIGLFLIAVMGTVYLGSRTTFVAQESGSRLQENGRFVMDTIAGDVRMSGFRGCLGANPVDNTLTSPGALLYDFATPIWGSRNGGAWSPVRWLPATCW
jgi:type IV pilus assembly protein PilW